MLNAVKLRTEQMPETLCKKTKTKFNSIKMVPTYSIKLSTSRGN